MLSPRDAESLDVVQMIGVTFLVRMDMLRRVDGDEGAADPSA